MKKLIALALVGIGTAAAAQQAAKVDVAVRMVNDRRSTGHFSMLGITLDLPKVQSTDVAALRVLVTSAVDDAGRDLRNAEAGGPELEPNPRLGMDGPGTPPAPASFGVTLKNPDRTATKIAEVRGEIELLMPSRDPNSVAEIPKFLPLSGKPLSHKALKANGVEIALLSAAQIAAEGISGLEDELLVRIKDPHGRIQQISYVDESGEVKPVMVRKGEGEEGLAYLSSWGTPQADWKIRVSMKTPKNVVRYAFAVKDVPLP